MNIDFSIVIPAKNEQHNLPSLLENIKKLHPTIDVIVINDGSTDETEKIAQQYGCKVISHPYSIGNGAAIKSGARAADTKYILTMDADGQHDPNDISKLLSKLNDGYSMVVGARERSSHASFLRKLANDFYNFIASKLTGHAIRDLTSGFRIVDRKLFCRYLYLLPNGFSYPTTITMAFFRSGHSVAYTNIIAKKRKGKSHINPLVDGLRFLIIILKVGSLYSPLKFFTPPSILLFIFGVVNYIYTYTTNGTFTNMSTLLILSSVMLFMFGMLAEQITVLTYASSQRRENE